MNNLKWISLVACLFVLACQSDKNPQASATKQPLPKNVRQIEKVVEEIDIVIDTLQERGPLAVKRDEANYEVFAYFQAGQPVILQAKTDQKEQHFYLLNRQVIQLNEYTYASNNGVTEQRYFYNSDTLLGAKTRTAADMQALQSTSFERLSETPDDAFYRSVLKVNTSATNFIYGN